MISFLDYIKYLAELPKIGGVIFSGSTAISGRFPKVGSYSYYLYSKDIEDMSQYGFFGFWKCLGDEEEVELTPNYYYYKCSIYNPETEEVVGYYYRYIKGASSETRKNDKIEVNGTTYTTTDGSKFKQGSTVMY